MVRNVADHLTHRRLPALMHQELFLLAQFFHRAQAFRRFLLKCPLGSPLAGLALEIIQSEGNICPHLLKQFHHLQIEKILLAGIEGQGTDGLAVQHDGKGCRSEDCCLARVPIGEAGSGIRVFITDAAASPANGAADDPRPLRLVIDRDADAVEKFDACPVCGNRSHHSRRPIHQSDPGHQESPVVDADLAGLAEQGFLVDGPDYGLVGAAQHDVQPVHSHQFVFGPLALADVRDGGPVQHLATSGIIHLNGLQQHRKQGLIGQPEVQFGADLPAVFPAPCHVAVKQPRILPVHMGHERVPHQLLPVGTQQFGAGKIDLPDSTLSVQGNVRQRSLVIQVGVAIVRQLQFVMDREQILVLHLQFLTIGFQFESTLCYPLLQLVTRTNQLRLDPAAPGQFDL